MEKKTEEKMAKNREEKGKNLGKIAEKKNEISKENGEKLIRKYT